MRIYVLLFAAFIIQEPITANALLLSAYQSHANIWIIHGLFIVATALDAIVLYYLGTLARNRFAEAKIVQWTKKKAGSFLDFAGKNGTRIALFVYGPIIFPISAFITPWLGISFRNSFIFLFLGDLIFWYGSLWIVVLGVKSFIPDPKYALYGVIGIALVVTILLHYIRRR